MTIDNITIYCVFIFFLLNKAIAFCKILRSQDRYVVFKKFARWIVSMGARRGDLPAGVRNAQTHSSFNI